MDDERLDNLLAQRYVPATPEGMAERIIAAAHRKPVRRSWLQEIRSLFVIPQPKVAFAACLVAGLYLGLQVESFIALEELEWGSFMQVDEVWI